MHSQQFVAYNATQKLWSAPSYPHWNFIKRSVGEAFLTHIRHADPQKVLEYYYDTNVEKTAGEIYRDAVTVAVNLQRLGIKPGDIIVLYSMNNTLTSALIMGSFLVGAVINFFETKLPKEHIDYMFNLMAPAVILYEESYAPDVHGALQRSSVASLKLTFSIDGTSAPNVSSELLRPISPQQLKQFQPVKVGDPMHETAAFALTSGSTGVPKLVDLSHSMLLHGLITWWYHTNSPVLPADAVVFSFSPLRWISQVQMMLQSLILGARRVCASGFPSGIYGREILSKGGITHFFGTPALFGDILQAVTEANDASALSYLRTVQLGGEPPSVPMLEMAKKMVSNGKVHFCYGMTEVSGVITNDEYINGGKLIPGMQLKILNENLQPVGPNVRGQLCIKAPVPFKGYYKLDNSQEFFADGFFLNGDYGYMDEHNCLHIEGRYKDLVRMKDVILIPSSIEPLVSALSEVNVARLVGYRKAATGKDTSGLFVIPAEGDLRCSEEIVRQKIRKLLEEKLEKPQYENIHEIHFVTKLPTTTSGKLDRAALRKKACQM